jgi:hypothetical protein
MIAYIDFDRGGHGGVDPNHDTILVANAGAATPSAGPGLESPKPGDALGALLAP